MTTLTKRQKEVLSALSSADSIIFYGNESNPDIRYTAGGMQRYVPIVVARNLIAKGLLKLTKAGCYSTRCEVVS